MAEKLSRLAAIGVAVVALALGVHVVGGMVVGSDPTFDQGVAPIEMVWIQELLGGVALVIVALTLRQARRTWRNRAQTARAFAWLGGAILAWSLWVVACVAEYAS